MTDELIRTSKPAAAPAPLWLRIGLTAFVAFLVPYYWRHYGPQNFLWLSDVGLFLTMIALWRANRLVISMMAVGVLPLPLHAVSLFHVALPIIWIWLLLRWRYDTRAFAAQTLLLWALLIASYALADPTRTSTGFSSRPSRDGRRFPRWLG